MNEFLKFAKFAIIILLCLLFGITVGRAVVVIFDNNIWTVLFGVPLCGIGGYFIGWLVNKMFDQFGGGFGLG